MARGKVDCVYESVVLRITGYLLENELTTPKAKDYNFNRPDKFTANCTIL